MLLIWQCIYSKLHDRDRCEVYEQIYPSFVNRKYTLRELPTQNAEYSAKDITLNRCAFETTGFIPEKFKLGTKTPNSENDCSGVHIIIEDHIDELMAAVNTHLTQPAEYDTNDASAPEPTCSSSMERTNYYSISEDRLTTAISKALDKAMADKVCTLQNNILDGGEVAEKVDRSNIRKNACIQIDTMKKNQNGKRKNTLSNETF